MQPPTSKAKGAKLLLIAIYFLFIIGSIHGGNNDEKQPQLPSPPPTIIDIIAKSIFSLPTRLSIPVPATAANYWMKFKKLLNLYDFSPPNLDFRRGSGRDEHGMEATDETPGEKVKEAIAKTLDKSKVTIEESAKTAARYAGEAMEKTAEKVKKRTSTHTSTESEAEL